ncbi:MAG: glycosyltransferase family 4 protein [Anaerolineales bacterium]|nr:glycosyltransferase family 4 protein [Chloroflexota bacterium]MBL6981598.1 glycosyltransferase family 4 protein [Anaerolineales bacterium]
MTHNIGMFHYIAGFTDGVSLEMNKWIEVLEDMGHTVHICAGKLGSIAEGTVIKEMYHHRPDARHLYYNTFQALRDYRDEATYRAGLFRLSDAIETKILKFIEDKEIDFFIPQNVWSVAANPAVAIALTNIMRKHKIPALVHNHDFYFERTNGFRLTCGTAVELADLYLPPRDPLVKHVVINSLAQQQLANRKGIKSALVPNVFDFEAPPWAPDEYNSDFRDRIGLRENDIMVLQATRIVTRKGIELAVDFVKALDSPANRSKLKAKGLYDGRKFDDDSRIVLVLAGYAMDDATGRYQSLLSLKAKELGVEAIFIEDIVDSSRYTRKGKKIYSLWDTYVFADFVTYPSIWEGWGNQLLEALRAKLPLVLFEYPVYEVDIKDKNLRVVSLGNQISGRDEHGLVTVDQKIIDDAANQAVDLLIDKELRQETVDHNFRMAKRFYSMDALHIYLRQLMNDRG